MKFVLASHNKGKLAEMQRILGQLGVEVVLQSDLGLALEPEENVAVKIRPLEVLKQCRRRVGSVQEVSDDILETMAHDATPGIEVRMRKNWREPRRP